MGRIAKSKGIEQQTGQSMKDILHDLYVTKERSIPQIALALGIGRCTVYEYLCRYEIPRRPRIDARAQWWESEGRWGPNVAEHMRRVQADYKEKATEKRAEYYRSHPRRHEQIAIDHLSTKGVPFKFQEPFGPYIVDFVLPTLSLILEVTSMSAIRNMGAEHGEKRRTFLEEQGYRVEYLIHTTHTPASRLALMIDKLLELQPQQSS